MLILCKLIHLIMTVEFICDCMRYIGDSFDSAKWQTKSKKFSLLAFDKNNWQKTVILPLKKRPIIRPGRIVWEKLIRLFQKHNDCVLRFPFSFIYLITQNLYMERRFETLLTTMVKDNIRKIYIDHADKFASKLRIHVSPDLEHAILIAPLTSASSL